MKRLEAIREGVVLSRENDVIDLNKGAVKIHEEAGGADHTASGAIASLTSGEALAFGDVCCVGSDGKLWKADASGADANPVAAMALESVTADASGSFLMQGFVRDDSWSWTPGGVVYASATPGALSQVETSGPVVGVATHANRMRFTPDMALSTRQVRLSREAGGADHTVSGATASLTAGETLVFGDICCLKSDGKYWKADADDVATLPGAVMALESMAPDASGSFCCAVSCATIPGVGAWAGWCTPRPRRGP